MKKNEAMKNKSAMKMKSAKKPMRKPAQKALRKSTKMTSMKASAVGIEPTDIIQLILRDHKPLKKLIQVMKSKTATVQKKKAAFEEFAPALLAHAKPEEKTWYICEKTMHGLVVQGLEGDIEHGLADQLCKELKSADGEDIFVAKVKVLAELVEHHIQEEEEHQLPTYKHRSTQTERAHLGREYEALRTQFQAPESTKAEQSNRKQLMRPVVPVKGKDQTQEPRPQ